MTNYSWMAFGLHTSFLVTFRSQHCCHVAFERAFIGDLGFASFL